MVFSYRNKLANYSNALSKNWAVVMALFAALLCFVIHVRFIGRPLMEDHAFRQTHTALTAYWMIAEGWRLDYQTPVVGYPWSIPFEFPIYQSIVAFLSGFFKLPLEPTGRTVSLLFLFALAWPAKLIVKELRLSKETTWVFCALLWSSPLYIFWGKSFMMETTALFLTFCTIPFLLRLRTPQPRYKDALWACLFGSLALLQKVTTALPAMMALGLLILVTQVFTPPFRLPSKRLIFCLLFAFAVPLAFSTIWTSHTDTLKSANEFGKTLTSTGLVRFNFGTLAQRFSALNNYEIFWHRLVSNNIAGFLGVLLIAGSLFFGARPVRQLVLFCLALWLLPIAIFYNLHRIHNYYQCSCLIYLVAALTVAVTTWVPVFTKHSLFMRLCVFALFCSNILMFATGGFLYKIKQNYTAQNDDRLALCKIINEATPRNSAIMVFGDDWSGTTAFYSQRKAFTVPDWWCLQTNYWNKATLTMGDENVAAVLYSPSEGMSLKQFLSKPEIQVRSQVYNLHNSYLWLPGVDSVRDPFTEKFVCPLSSQSLDTLRTK